MPTKKEAELFRQIMRMYGSQGGKKASSQMTPEQRKERSRKAGIASARVRWGTKPSEDPAPVKVNGLLAAAKAVLHELTHGAAGEGDLREIKWCAAQLAAAIPKEERDKPR